MMTDNKVHELLQKLLQPEGPTCLVIKAKLQPVGDVDRFQPAGFPEIGHVLYDAPRSGNTTEKVCIVDSPASMANHLEVVCLAGPNEAELHPDLEGLPYVVCTTDNTVQLDGDTAETDPQKPHDKKVFTSLTEGHRIASEYFLDGLTNPQWREEQRVNKRRGKEKIAPAYWEWKTFRAQLREEFGIVEVKKDKTYFIHPENWWTIYQTIFKYDPNSLVHGVMFAREQIKISRLLTAHLEAFGASRVGRSGVKFDRLGKTLSGQPIFAVDEETAREIRATFLLDLALLRSYGRNGQGLHDQQKSLLLGLALWKVRQLLAQPFRFRSQCHLLCTEVEIGFEERDEHTVEQMHCASLLNDLNIQSLITACHLSADPVTRVYYPINELFKPGKDDEQETNETNGEDEEEAETED
jgi:CRISPR-associated protein Csb1